MTTKAFLRKDVEGVIAYSKPKGEYSIDVEHGIAYDFVYDDEDNFYIISDGYMFEEVSTCFDFKEI